MSRTPIVAVVSFCRLHSACGGGGKTHLAVLVLQGGLQLSDLAARCIELRGQSVDYLQQERQ
jgi:hypothetical protein